VKPARLRGAAKQDLSDAAVYYAEQGGLALGEDFLLEATAELSRIEDMPGLGSLRAGQLCGVDGLRAWPVKRFPLRWFYFERDSHLDVVRLLGDRRDVAAVLRSLLPA
jgi:toxin ParE1/3/4